MIDRDKVVEMYNSGESISSIMKLCNIKSTQTVYRIIRDAGLKIRNGNCSLRLSVTLDAESGKLLQKHHPKNVSRWVCEAIKNQYK